MLDYLEKYYIGVKNPKNLNQRKVPTFPIKIWNMHEKTVSGN